MNGKRVIFDMCCSVENAEHVPGSVAMRCVMLHFLGRAGRFVCAVLCPPRWSQESKEEERRAKEREGEQRRTRNKQHKHQQQNKSENKRKQRHT